MSFLSRLHGEYVFSRRARVLSARLSELLPPNAHVLDVGCGDGTIARLVMERRPDVTIEGIDVLVRPQTAIPVTEFDGRDIPKDDDSVDAVMFVDVLHHTNAPEHLLAEAARVARSAVVIKDHTREGPFAEELLRFMDWVGNARHGVALPYNYWTLTEWRRALSAVGLDVERWESSLHLYPRPASWVFDASLHFVGRMRPPEAASAHAQVH